MSKQYYCKMDNSVFSTEEELINHIRNRYVQVLENKDHEPSDLLHKLQKEFPDYEVHIKDGAGWYSQYVITLSKDGLEIDQYYGNDERDSVYNYGKPSSYADVIKELKEKINEYEYIVKRVKETYNFTEFKFSSYTYGYSNDEHCYKFVFKANEFDPWDSIEYYPSKSEAFEFVYELKKYFVKKLEGKPERFYDGSYFTDYTIDGVEIGIIMDSNKKVRLEVIE